MPPRTPSGLPAGRSRSAGCAATKRRRRRREGTGGIAETLAATGATQVGPAMRPQLVALVSHALRRNLEETAIPSSLRALPGMERAEDRLSLQLSNGLVDSLLNLSRRAGDRLVRRTRCCRSWAFRRWIVLGRAARTLERVLCWNAVRTGCCVPEELKRNSMTQLRSQKDVDALIKELDGLNFNQQFSLPDLGLKPVKPTIRPRRRALDQLSVGARACNAWSRVMALTAAAPRAR